MSATLINLLIEGTVVWSVLLIYYLLAFRSTHDWTTHRRYLLLAWIFGLVLPVLPSIDLGSSMPAAARLPGELMGYLAPATVVQQPTAVAPSYWTWSTILTHVWLAGAMGSGVVAVLRLLAHLRPRPVAPVVYRGYQVIKSQHVKTPYAVRGRIYLPTKLDPAVEQSALLHEAAHLDAGHDRERLFLLLGNIVLWFHPLQWVFTRLLTSLHEYEADRVVIGQLPAHVYGLQLLQVALSPRLVSGLFSSPLKKRIMYLQRETTARPFGYGKWTVLVILLAGLLVACSQELTQPPLEVAAEAVPFGIEALQFQANAPKLRDDRYPSFMEAMYQEIRYPQQELARNELGKVLATISLSATGELTDLTTRIVLPMEQLSENNTLSVIGAGQGGDINVSAINTAFAEEVARTIRTLGAFQPAMQGGTAVPAVIQFSVVFFPEDPPQKE
ncbi:M56 family metallopeptidase [Neolewinella sp.]|uniref:M56 family metallopeptidase n=1 Tax=Neolewinella sp. TaxID=2993543 RepID=UPI003B51B9B9